MFTANSDVSLCQNLCDNSDILSKIISKAFSGKRKKKLEEVILKNLYKIRAHHITTGTACAVGSWLKFSRLKLFLFETLAPNSKRWNYQKSKF